MAYTKNTSQFYGAIFSTDFCLSQLTDFVLTSMDEGMHTCMILIDFQKALDTKDHKLLSDKMTCVDFKTPDGLSLILIKKKRLRFCG